MRELVSETPSMTPPDPDEFELSVFGPGYGECLVIHLGNRRWMVIDSCVRKRTEVSVAVEYLDALDVKIEKSVQAVVATHWHDDHVRGLHTVVRRAENAIFYCSSAFRSNEFLALVDRTPALPSKHSSGTSELRMISREIDARRRSGGRALSPIRSSTRLFMCDDSPVVAVWALSPSDEDIARGVEHIASLIPLGNDPGLHRVPSLHPNDTSIALLIELSDGCGVLLGADLEHFPSDRMRGWHAALDNPGRPNIRSVVFKVPHHGAVSSHCPEVWEHLLEADPLCVLSPFQLGSRNLPTPEDLARLQKLSSLVLISAGNTEIHARRERSVEKKILSSVKSIRSIGQEIGHIQLRRREGKWSARLSREAACFSQ
ncbi:hypothetical protein FDG2_5218 [Candidatus Protofrankia californiensis]|uniref:Metallo-beta-lactamase domain-containing protein n=1 Tax=Candidatus Protofrankia californiensis TaxID=1839754 RepID=A0A1C3PBL3_9ACTN|nr:hypothetical protein FDG2_5218 [Candidatus Protofrankia californiensis]